MRRDRNTDVIGGTEMLECGKLETGFLRVMLTLYNNWYGKEVVNELAPKGS